MRDEFLKKLNNQRYISLHLYNQINMSYKEIIPNDFDIRKYNNQVLEQEYLKYKDFFDNMYLGIDDNIHLDKEQIYAILSDEDYLLILAGAGTGKTTTMASKVKYLVDIKKVNPQEILVMSYTKKATEELIQRINIDFEIPARIMTFHSLGYTYIKEIFKDRKCYIVDDLERNRIFLEFFDTYIYRNKDMLSEVIEIFSSDRVDKPWVFSNYFKENYHKYQTYNELFESYKEYLISKIGNLEEYVLNELEFELNQENIWTINNELVKSKGEAIIANYLYMHGITYSYEKVYSEYVDGNKIYKPDFTIDYYGNSIYLEYFGLSEYNSDTDNRYLKNRQLKMAYHKKHKTNFIALDYMKNEDIIITLERELKKYGFKLEKKSYEEIYRKMLDRNRLRLIYHLKELFYDVIQKIKSSLDRENYKQICLDYIDNYIYDSNEKHIYSRQLYYIVNFYRFYQASLFSNPLLYGFDFEDMIYYANNYVHNVRKKELSFKYLIIDEYQDISYQKYELTKNVIEINNSKIMAVGDDWQSIYAFNGSKVEYIYNFQKYFPNSIIMYINKTYRNSQALIDYSGDFIMRNDVQIKKSLVSDKILNRPVKFIPFIEDEEITALKELIIEINKNNPHHNILILCRKNRQIRNCFNDPELIDSVGTKVKLLGFEDIDIDLMTIHKSKGLSADEVIIIGLDNTFPSDNYHGFWIKKIFANKVADEGISFPEERRIFYVALTRTKNNVYLLVNRNPKRRSPFIRELYDIVKDKS